MLKLLLLAAVCHGIPAPDHGPGGGHHHHHHTTPHEQNLERQISDISSGVQNFLRSHQRQAPNAQQVVHTPRLPQFNAQPVQNSFQQQPVRSFQQQPVRSFQQQQHQQQQSLRLQQQQQQSLRLQQQQQQDAIRFQQQQHAQSLRFQQHQQQSVRNSLNSNPAPSQFSSGGSSFRQPVNIPSNINRERFDRFSEEDDDDEIETTTGPPYAFQFQVDDRIEDQSQARYEVRKDGRIEGVYSYSDGFSERTVHYVADEDGYRVIKEDVRPLAGLNRNLQTGQASVASQFDGGLTQYTVNAADISSLRSTTEQPNFNLNLRGFDPRRTQTQQNF